jgi:hypothetical protein
VVWQFWGRAAEASWIEKSKTLFIFQHSGASKLAGRSSRAEDPRWDLACATLETMFFPIASVIGKMRLI